MKKGLPLLVLSTSILYANDESVTTIELSIHNNTNANVDIVVEHRPSDGLGYYEGRDFYLSSWPVINLEPGIASQTQTYSEMRDGSTVRIYAFQTSTLDQDQLLLSSMTHHQMKHLGTTTCKVESGILECQSDAALSASQSGYYGSVSLNITVWGEDEASATPTRFKL
jgi:hypothetical protein